MKLHSSIDREFLDEKIAQYNFKKMKADFKGLYDLDCLCLSPSACAVHGYSDSNYSGRDAIQTIRAWNADRKLDLAIVRGACGRSMGYSPA
jgi:hypothetical protein